MHIAVTKLVLKDASLSTIFNFIDHTRASRIQAQASPGYLSHGYNVVGGLYTRSAWASREDIMSFKNSGAHKEAMDIAARIAKGGMTIVFEAQTLPSWKEAKARLHSDGRDLAKYLETAAAQQLNASALTREPE